MSSLEERVEKLEQAVFRTNGQERRKDWRRTVGMFRDDPVMKEVIDEALRARAEEREQSVSSEDGAEK
ncbi:MAG: hypothetical protein H8E37_09205 [Planctomycetes bacterium]|nr:hypothetical protein [Planctomycetota bacterium]